MLKRLMVGAKPKTLEAPSTLMIPLQMFAPAMSEDSNTASSSQNGTGSVVRHSVNIACTHLHAMQFARAGEKRSIDSHSFESAVLCRH